MTAPWYPVGKMSDSKRQIPDFGHRLIFVRELEQVKISVGHHHVLGLTTHPAAHIDVAIGSTGPGRIDVQADTRLANFAVPAPAAGNIEGYRNQIALLNELNIATGLNDQTGYFVTQHQPGGCRGTSPNHVLITTADIGRHDLQNNAVLAFAITKGQLGILDFLYFNYAGANVGNAMIVTHNFRGLER